MSCQLFDDTEASTQTLERIDVIVIVVVIGLRLNMFVVNNICNLALSHLKTTKEKQDIDQASVRKAQNAAKISPAVQRRTAKLSSTSIESRLVQVGC